MRLFLPHAQALASARSEWEAARDSYNTTIQTLGLAPFKVDDKLMEHEKQWKMVMNIFYAAQSLLRKLKPEETRSSICERTKAADGFSEIPKSLYDAVCTASVPEPDQSQAQEQEG